MNKFEDVKDVSCQEYFSGEQFACDVFKNKYCHTKENGEKETPAEVFYRVASGLLKNKDEIDICFSLMYEGWFRPGGSVLQGVGSNVKSSLANCTTIPLSGDSLEDISKCDYDVMKCAAFRQGIGFDASKLRPEDSKINNAAQRSTGVVPWINKIVDNGKYVGQLGRMPALLVSLSDTHPDIFTFIKSKIEKGQIENANISVQISDKFMESVKSDSDWELRFDFDNGYESIVKIVKAKEIFDLIAETAYKSAEPGVQFCDQLRKGMMIHQIYVATGNPLFKGISTNACSEKYLPPYGICNLNSINMEMFDAENYETELEKIVPYIVRLSDAVVDYELIHNLSPLPEQRWILEQTREIGCGITNIHGWLMKQNLAYDSDEGIDKVAKFWKKYASIVFKTSVELGKEKGSAQAYSMIAPEGFMGSSYYKNMIDKYYDGKPVKYMRNMAHMSIAPTGSLSNTFPKPCVSSGIEPVIAPYYWRKTRIQDRNKYQYYFVIPNRIHEFILDSIEKNSEDYKKMAEFSGSILDEDGSIGKEYIEIIERNLPKGFFKPSHEIDYRQKIKLMSKIYKWMDASISCTYNLPKTATVDDVKNIYMAAYEYKIRAVSVYVEGSREGILLTEFPKDQTICDENRPVDICYNCAPRRPKELSCNIHQITAKGEKWVVLVGMFNEKPFEIFCGSLEDIYLPQKCSEGYIVKQGNGKYSLKVKVRNSDVVYEDIAGVLMSDNEKALTRLLSLNLRHGVYIQFIVDQLKKSKGDITSFSTAISRVLGKYVVEYVMKDNVCPMCGKSSLSFEEGCIKCLECEYSRCD
jgi:ribonucleoside-diphosphate reductase alpha chain